MTPQTRFVDRRFHHTGPLRATNAIRASRHFGKKDERSVNVEEKTARAPRRPERPTPVILAVTLVTCRSRLFDVPQAVFATGLGIAMRSA
jgi:hypothetical protein